MNGLLELQSAGPSSVEGMDTRVVHTCDKNKPFIYSKFIPWFCKSAACINIIDLPEFRHGFISGLQPVWRHCTYTGKELHNQQFPNRLLKKSRQMGSSICNKWRWTRIHHMAWGVTSLNPQRFFHWYFKICPNETGQVEIVFHDAVIFSKYKRTNSWKDFFFKNIKKPKKKNTTHLCSHCVFPFRFIQHGNLPGYVPSIQAWVMPLYIIL